MSEILDIFCRMSKLRVRHRASWEVAGPKLGDAALKTTGSG
jgi:hypothetical protein